MKKFLTIPIALFILTIGLNSLYARHITSVQFTNYQDIKVLIKPDDMPTKVKVTITGDSTLAKLTILEVWKISKKDDTALYKVIFDAGNETQLTKKYNEAGIEVKE